MYGGWLIVLWGMQEQGRQQMLLRQEHQRAQQVLLAQEALQWHLNLAQRLRLKGRRHPLRIPQCVTGWPTCLGITDTDEAQGDVPVQVVDCHGHRVADAQVGMHGWKIEWRGNFFIVKPPINTQGTHYEIRSESGYSAVFDVIDGNRLPRQVSRSTTAPPITPRRL